MTYASACRETFEVELAELIATLDANPEVTGLVLAGSTADRARVDEWSDLDFLVVAASDEAAVRMRDDLTWLPRSDRIVLRGGLAIDTTLPDYRELDDLMEA